MLEPEMVWAVLRRPAVRQNAAQHTLSAAAASGTEAALVLALPLRSFSCRQWISKSEVNHLSGRYTSEQATLSLKRPSSQGPMLPDAHERYSSA